MNPLIESRRSELEQFCKRFRVKRLDLFGSAATGDFKSEASDLDFLVEFNRCAQTSVRTSILVCCLRWRICFSVRLTSWRSGPSRIRISCAARISHGPCSMQHEDKKYL